MVATITVATYYKNKLNLKKMKKIIFLLFAFTFTSAVIAQNVLPRFKTATYGREAGTKLNAYVAATDATGTDTVVLKPQAAKTIVAITVVDSVTFQFSSVKNSYVGDEVVIIAKNGSGATHRIKVATTNATTSSSGDVTLASTLGAVIRYIFNGVKWVEASRAVQ